MNQQETILELLRQHAPEVFSENKIDVKQLRATLGEEVLADAERYGLNWAGKMDCFRTIQETTTNTLKPVRDESVDFDNTENLFIEGDNLEVLKVLQKSYYGKVKMIYIDPPYNTGNDFVYSDKFSRTKREELIANGSMDEDGNVVNHDLYRQNTRDGGHFHSNWLNMMYPRLFLAKNLLKKDGVIFISIDDNEVHNLRIVMDEIFGEENFVANMVRQTIEGGKQDSNTVQSIHEYVLVYCKNSETLNLNKKIQTDFGHYNKVDKYFETRGNYYLKPLENGGLGYVKSLDYSIEGPECIQIFPGGEYGDNGYRWIWSKDRVQDAIKNDFIEFLMGNDGSWKVYYKIYQFVDSLGEPIERSNPYKSFFLEGYTNRQASGDLKRLFPEKRIFEYSKPINFLKELTQMGTNAGEIVLDFFAGSGTTSDAVMQLNAEDGGNRKYICVQLPEKCREGTEAAKAGFGNIADIAKERIRRAGKKIQEENSEKKIDIGFKAFKLDQSNFKIWNTHVTSIEQLEQQMIEMFDNVRGGSTKEAMMYELILKSGEELNVAIEEREAGEEKYFRVNDGSLVICLADKLSKELFTGILVEKPKKIIVLDKSFGNDDQLKTNLLLQAEGAGVDEVRVI